MRSAVDLDWVFNIPAPAKGWILDAICREIGARVKGVVTYAYNSKVDLPKADVYFFAHYWNYLDRLRSQPEIVKSKILIWYTHPREIPYSIKDQLRGYSKATRVVFTNNLFMTEWLKYGLPVDKACVVLGGADPQVFKWHERTGRTVGLSSSYYPRKGADRIHALIKSMPHSRFCLLGRKWVEYPDFHQLTELSNFEYHESDYSKYPSFYNKFDVFLSMSTLEGGPIPVLEAMMSNVVPVASRTGFARDLIRDGENGYTFDVDAPLEQVKELIEQAYLLNADVRETVLKYSWDFFAYEIISQAD